MLRNRPRMVLFVLLALSARVFTGAAEAQVSFSSLVADANFYSTVADHNFDSGMKLSDPKEANPSPKEPRNTVTYKKYLTPENSNIAIYVDTSASIPRDNSIALKKQFYYASPLRVLPARSPPATSFVNTNTSASQTYSLISWESERGPSTINNDTGGIGSL